MLLRSAVAALCLAPPASSAFSLAPPPLLPPPSRGFRSALRFRDLAAADPTEVQRLAEARDAAVRQEVDEAAQDLMLAQKTGGC